MYRIVLNETSYYGAGCRSAIVGEVRKRGFRKALLVTDKELIRFGVAAKIEKIDLKIDGDFVDMNTYLKPRPFERIRRITGYLVGTLDRFNNAKRAEERDRVKHNV